MNPSAFQKKSQIHSGILPVDLKTVKDPQEGIEFVM